MDTHKGNLSIAIYNNYYNSSSILNYKNINNCKYMQAITILQSALYMQVNTIFITVWYKIRDNYIRVFLLSSVRLHALEVVPPLNYLPYIRFSSCSVRFHGVMLLAPLIFCSSQAFP